MEKELNTYSSLDDIRLRKLRLKGEILANEKKIGQLWNSLFYVERQRKVQTPSQKLVNIVNTGAGVVDGVLLGWKLYRRFIR